MITDLVKRWTGLMAAGGVGLLLRAAAFGAMSWASWSVYGWIQTLDGEYELLLVALAVFGVVVATGRGVDDNKWGLRDFLRRAPFIFWCVMTDDGCRVPLWAILAWPAAVAAEVVLTAILLLCLVAHAVGRTVWRLLSIVPFQSDFVPNRVRLED